MCNCGRKGTVKPIFKPRKVKTIPKPETAQNKLEKEILKKIDEKNS